MVPYYTLIAIPLIFAIYYELICEQNYIYSKKNYTIVVFFVILFCLIAFRSENIGADTSRYILLYEVISNCNWQEVFRFSESNIGYYVFSKIVSIFFDNPQVFLFIVAAIIIWPIAVLYYKETKNSLISIALYMAMPIFQMSFSGIRQSIAMAFVLPAIYCIKQRQLIKFIIIIFIASLFHSSAIIMITMYPIYHCTIKVKHLFIVIPIGVLILRFNTQIYMFLLTVFPDTYEERYGEIEETGAYTMLFVFAMFVLYAFVFTDDEKFSYDERGYRNFLVIALFLQMFAPINTIAMRMNYYYIIFIPIIITQLTDNLKTEDKNTKIIVKFIIYMMFTIYYVYITSSVDSLDIYPYKFFWQ